MSVGGAAAIGFLVGFIAGGVVMYLKYGPIARKVDELESALAKAVKALKDGVK